MINYLENALAEQLKMNEFLLKIKNGWYFRIG